MIIFTSLLIVISSCTYMNISGSENHVNVDKTGTEVDTMTEVDTEEEDEE